MPDFIAAKSLASSDLTFFERLYRNLNVGAQKCINLNADVLIGQFYPDLENLLDPDSQELRIGLNIYGPAAAPKLHVTRKIIKGRNYKNWRLNGEFIYDPEDQPGRFELLRADDIAIIAFDGRPAPHSATMVLLARAAVEDVALQRVFASLIPGGRRSMISLTAEQISSALAQLGVPKEHPLALLARDPVAEAALEDVAQGGTRSLRKLRSLRRGRPVTKSELERAKRSAELTGAAGEELVNEYLGRIQNPGGAFDYEWTSETNAVSPFDFRCKSEGGAIGSSETEIEVKSTRGEFEADFHISLSEVLHAAASTVEYRIYRVFNLTDNGGNIAISADMRPFAKSLKEAHERAMPGGVAADSFSVPVDTPGLIWNEPLSFVLSDEA